MFLQYRPIPSITMATTNTRKPNPIKSDPALKKLLEDSSFSSENAFAGWRKSFMEQYKQYLDPDGVDNAHASDRRLSRSLDKLCQNLLKVKELLEETKISAEIQTVVGEKSLTDMTDQIAKTEKELARYMPATAEDEETVGYDKFELGAVVIEDGFQVYEVLTVTKGVLETLLETIAEALPSDKQSTIRFYLRQIQSFCDVMADLGLLSVMEEVTEMYKVKPRKKKGKKLESEIFKPEEKEEATEPAPQQKQEPPPKKERVLDPNKTYNFRTAFDNGYYDPFTGESPGAEEVKDDDEDNDEEDGEGDEDDVIIYFDVKTGAIGKISRNVCIEKQVIVMVDDKGNENLDGEINDNEKKEQLLWDMKKAAKSSAREGDSERPRLAAKKSFGKSSDKSQRRVPKEKSSSNSPSNNNRVGRKSSLDDVHDKPSGSSGAKSINKINKESNPPTLSKERAQSKSTPKDNVTTPKEDKTSAPAAISKTTSATENPPTKQKVQRTSSSGGLEKTKVLDGSSPKRGSIDLAKSSDGSGLFISNEIDSGWSKPSEVSAKRGAAQRAKSSDGWSKPGDFQKAHSQRAVPKPTSPMKKVKSERPSSEGWCKPADLGAKRASATSTTHRNGKTEVTQNVPNQKDL